MKRKRAKITVVESKSRLGHRMIRFWGPVRWAKIFIAPERIIVQHGLLTSSIHDGPAAFFLCSEETKAVAHARRYARRCT